MSDYSRAYPPPLPSAPSPPPLPHSAAVFNPPTGHADLAVGEALSEAWRIFTANYGFVLGASMLTMLLTMGASMIGSWLALFVTIPIMSGMIHLSVVLARGRKPEFETLFDGFKRYWPVLGAGLLKVLIAAIPVVLLIPAIIGLVVSIVALTEGWKNPEFAVVGIVISALVMLAAFCTMLFIQIRLILVEALVMDDRLGACGAVDAIKTSWRLTGPVIWPLIGLYLCMTALSLVCMLFLILPIYFVALPLWFTLVGVIYTRIVGGVDPFICRQCGYDLGGTNAAMCPECGTARVV